MCYLHNTYKAEFPRTSASDEKSPRNAPDLSIIPQQEEEALDFFLNNKKL
jgi:hypothetical protein